MSTKTIKVTLGNIEFVGKAPASKRNPEAVEAHYLVQFERKILELLCRFGEPSGEGFRFLRSRSGIRANEIAPLLGVEPETISRWEHGKFEVPLSAWELMVTIAKEKIEGKSVTFDELKARRARRTKAPKRMDVSSGRELSA